MAYTKPHTYVDGNVLSADQHNQNEVSAKKFINQDIRQADFKENTFNTQDLSTGELQPITNQYDFPTGETQGFSKGSEVFEIRPKLFDYLIFPFDLLHYVLPEKRKEKRICYAFNLTAVD